MNELLHKTMGVVVVMWTMITAPAVAATKVYEKPSDFLERHFGSIPKTQVIDLDKADQTVLKKILGHQPESRRIRYWQSGGKVAWILNEVGKTQPITTGFIVSGGKIVEIKVLIYRESHGWEVSRPFFTRQFVGASLKDGKKIDRSIDGTVGATLSVRALTKLSTAALYLTEQVD